jgi:uncharacterized protein with ParB-like and HNH nuclease domain
LFDFNKLNFEDFMKELWHPSIKLVDIAERVSDFVDKNLAPIKDIPSGLIRKTLQLNLSKKKIILGLMILRVV